MRAASGLGARVHGSTHTFAAQRSAPPSETSYTRELRVRASGVQRRRAGSTPGRRAAARARSRARSADGPASAVLRSGRAAMAEG